MNIEERISAINKELLTLEKDYTGLPDGKIFCCRHGKYVKWYISDGKNNTYIPKSNWLLAEKLAYKKYIELRRAVLLSEKASLQFQADVNKKAIKKYENFLLDESYQSLLSNRQINAKNYDEWMSADYERNNKYPEHLIHETVRKLKVRSKAESMIAICLNNENIPFRYEMKLSLQGCDIYPDFTIINPTTGKQFYWEHFGMMDNMFYASDFSKKILTYTSNGIIPGDTLIMTFETSDNPLTISQIQRLIDVYFLS